MSETKRLRGRPKAFTEKPEQSRIQSLDRALDVLALVAGGNGMTLSEIAGALEQSPATIYRILSTFAARGHLEMDAASQEWHIGANAFRTGSAFLRRTGVVERARPFMRRLMAQTGETANLGIESAGQVLFLSQVEAHEAIRAFFPPGTRAPMHASGIGKALLAHADAAAIRRYLSAAPLERFTDNTICAAEDMEAELARIRRSGTAFDNEEKSPGMRCVAAPVWNGFGEVVAGLSVSGPTARLSLARIAETCALVRQAAADLSHALGYRE